MENLARKPILDIKPYQPGRPIEEVRREFGLKEIVKLASNENPLGPSPKAISAIKKALKGLNRYPDGSCFYLKRRLASKLGLSESNLILGNGSDEIIFLAVRAFLGEGQETLIAEPTFLIYKLVCLAAGAKIISVPLLKNFKYDLKAMRKAITNNTKMVFIANPDNPTGTYVTESEVKEFFDGLPPNLIVYFDEAYFEFIDKENYPDTIKYLKDKNIIITRTFSKAYGLSGLRIGYGISSPELIDYMDRVREPFNVSSLAQAGALAALDDEGHLRKTKKTIREGKRYLYENLKVLNLSYIPSAANFILIDMKCDGEEVCQKMLRLGVILRDMKAYKLDNFIRVTVGTEEENKRFIGALKKVIKEVL